MPTLAGHNTLPNQPAVNTVRALYVLPAAARYPCERHMPPRTSLVVFSDVDAVLCAPRDPAFAAAGHLLRLHLPEDVALVFCSGKTRAELEFIQQMLGVWDPFIAENGGAAFIPDGYFDVDIPSARDFPGYSAVEFGRPYADVVDELHRIADRLAIPIVGFNDMSIEEVAREYGLSLLQARLAKLREYEECFRVVDPSRSAGSRLVRALHAARLRCVSEDAFYYVGAPVDYCLGVNLLDGLYRRAANEVVTIAVTNASREDNLSSLVDRRVMDLDADIAAGTVSVLDWAEAIINAVHESRKERKALKGVSKSAANR